MKLQTTLTTTVELSVKRDGETIGDTINHVIMDCLLRDETITNVSLDVTKEDWIALKLLRAPAHDDFGPSSIKPRKPNVFRDKDD